MAEAKTPDLDRAVDEVLERGSGGGHRTVLRLAWAGGVIMFAAIAYFYFLGPEPSGEIRFLTDRVTRGVLTELVTATGSVQPTNKVDVSSELSGNVRRVFVDFNSPVSEGQVLAELDTDRLTATIESSRARLAVAKAKVAEAEATVEERFGDYERKRELATTRTISTQELDAAKAAYSRAVAGLTSATADVGVAEAALVVDESNLRKASIRSPINGVVLVRNVEPGQTVAASLQAPVLFSIAEDLAQMELRVDIDEADVGKVREGQSASFSVDAYPGRRFPAMIRVLRFAPENVQGVVTYKAVLSVDNSELLVRPGMTATAEITVSQVMDAILVPNAALRYTPPALESESTDQGFLSRLMPRPPRVQRTTPTNQTSPNRQVWILREGKPISLTLAVGVTDGRMTELVQGALKPGDEVIVGALAAAQ